MATVVKKKKKSYSGSENEKRIKEGFPGWRRGGQMVALVSARTPPAMEDRREQEADCFILEAVLMIRNIFN